MNRSSRKNRQFFKIQISWGYLWIYSHSQAYKTGRVNLEDKIKLSDNILCDCHILYNEFRFLAFTGNWNFPLPILFIICFFTPQQMHQDYNHSS